MNGSGAKTLFRIRNIIILLLAMNSVVILNVVKMQTTYSIVLTIFLIGIFLYINIVPIKVKNLSRRLIIMIQGYELVVECAFLIGIENIIYLTLLLIKLNELSTKTLLINAVIAVFIFIISIVNGIFRLIFTSRNLGVINRVLIIFCWWIPIFNIIIIVNCLKTIKYEYFYEENKLLRNEARQESEICNTKYPIVLVHGIFFRDWMLINYWGRIPKELIRNGAEIFYGQQQSSNPVCESAEELKENILKIIDETGCEKVNIIAHSKGGLDARYAISCLGLSEYVASLTTINTPHRGCKYVDFLLDKIPEGFKEFVAKKYNKIFTKLGDNNPDFLAGVTDLTAKRCRELNKQMEDVDGVLYQSSTSKMDNLFAAGFPLNIGYICAKIFDGENDGLVGLSSAKWGEFLGVMTAGKRGISHGDVVDLTRQDIKEYDVCEFYVEIVKNLKEKGF